MLAQSEGEGCLSVDREVPGYVVRHAKSRFRIMTKTVRNKNPFKNYESIVVQHEIDHINGVMFYDHINDQNPFALKRRRLGDRVIMDNHKNEQSSSFNCFSLFIFIITYFSRSFFPCF